MKMLLRTLVVSVVSGFASQALAKCDPGETVIRFGLPSYSAGHPAKTSALSLQGRVDSQLNGMACMEVRFDDVLYADKKALDALISNDLQMAAPVLSSFDSYSRQFRLFELPFLFRNIDAVIAFQKSDAGKNTKKSLLPSGLLGLTFWNEGMKQMSAKTPIIWPRDANGLKFRVRSAGVPFAQIRAVGGTPQIVERGQLREALQTSVVDGQEDTWTNIHAGKFIEVQDGITETDHGVAGHLVVTGRSWWEGLKPELRDGLVKIIDETANAANDATAKANVEARRAILKEGGIIRTLTDEQRGAWIEAMRPVWERFRQDAGASNIAAVLEINKRF